MNFPKTEQNRECVPYCTRTKRVGLKLKQIYTGCELTRRPRLPRCYMNYLYYTYNRHTIVRRVSSIRKIQIVCCLSTTESRIMCGVAGTDTETAFRAADAIRFASVRRGAARCGAACRRTARVYRKVGEMLRPPNGFNVCQFQSRGGGGYRNAYTYREQANATAMCGGKCSHTLTYTHTQIHTLTQTLPHMVCGEGGSRDRSRYF